MKLVTMYVNDVIKMSRGDEVVEVMLTENVRKDRSQLGIRADLCWKIELFRGDKPVMKPSEKKD